MKESIYRLLDDLETAVADGDTSGFAATLDDLVDTYDQVKAREQVRKARALAAMQVVPFDSTAKDDLESLVAAHAQVNMVRAGLLAGSGGYVRSPAAVAASDVTDAIANTREAEQSYDDAAAAADPAMEDVTVPPSLALGTVDAPAEPLPKGVSFSLGALLTNSGDQAATGVTGDGTVDDRVHVEPTDVPGTVDPASVADSTFTVTPTASGDLTLGVSVDSENAGDASKSVSVRVLDKTGFIDAALDAVAALESELRSETPFGGQTKGYVSKLQTATRKLEHAKRESEAGRVKQTHNQLSAATNALGAFLNKVDAARETADNVSEGGGKGNAEQPSDALLATLERQAEGIEGQIADARRASL